MSGIRVISGSARGRRLKQVSGTDTRPISDRVKEALCNIIGLDVHDANFLDLFGGTGSVGIEALSRGAARAIFLDTSRRAIETIRSNLSVTGFSARSEVLQTDALTYLERPPRTGFDYIYIAPPQYQGLWAAALQRIDNIPSWLNSDGWAIVQIHPSEFSELELKQLTLFDRRRYGNTMLCFYSLPQRDVEI
jgi:16S rRNA (guanine(966)-N(2))-methyltransferase RsmD|tara:strand:+ start:20 stop:595 length:576 start_codon:yes stop_codon:yes gene_type:complete